MQITLSPEHESLVAAKIASGDYASMNEVLTDAFTLLEKRDAADRAAFDRELAERIESLDRGEFVTPEEVREELAEMSRQRRSASA